MTITPVYLLLTPAVHNSEQNVEKVRYTTQYKLEIAKFAQKMAGTGIEKVNLASEKLVRDYWRQWQDTIKEFVQ